MRSWPRRGLAALAAVAFLTAIAIAYGVLVDFGTPRSDRAEHASCCSPRAREFARYSRAPSAFASPGLRLVFARLPG